MLWFWHLFKVCSCVLQSTLFNALCENGKAEVANYPFCTIEPNVGLVAVPDERLKVSQHSPWSWSKQDFPRPRSMASIKTNLILAWLSIQAVNTSQNSNAGHRNLLFGIRQNWEVPMWWWDLRPIGHMTVGIELHIEIWGDYTHNNWICRHCWVGQRCQQGRRLRQQVLIQCAGMRLHRSGVPGACDILKTLCLQDRAGLIILIWTVSLQMQVINNQSSSTLFSKSEPVQFTWAGTWSIIRFDVDGAVFWRWERTPCQWKDWLHQRYWHDQLRVSTRRHRTDRKTSRASCQNPPQKQGRRDSLTGQVSSQESPYSYGHP